MNLKNKKKFIIIFIIIILLIISYLLFFQDILFAKKIDISIENGNLYPIFNNRTEKYVYYTTNDSFKINCINLNNSICNKDIYIKNDREIYSIKHKKNTYLIEVIKLPKKSSTIKITNISGNPTSWVKDTNIKVEIENKYNYPNVMYSFDGGVNWQKKNIKKISSNENLKIVVKDYFNLETEVKDYQIENIDNIAPKVIISKNIDTNSKYILKAYALDDESGVSSFLWNNGKNTNSITVDKKGVYSVEVSDKVGNKEKSEIVIDDSNMHEKIFVANFISNGSKHDELRSCKTSNNSCVITSPTIERNEYDAIGFDENKNAKNAMIHVNQVISLTKDITLYAITKSKEKIDVNFEFQDTKVSPKKVETVSSNKYNLDEDFTLNAPELKLNNGYELIGFSNKKSEIEPIYKVNDEIKVDKETKYYVITKNKEPLVATFSMFDSNAGKINNNTASCFKYNGSNSCTVTIPKIITNTGYSAIGWTDNKDSVKPIVGDGKNIEIKNNTLLYSITFYPIKITFDRNKTLDNKTNIEASELSFYTTTCDNYNNKGCYLKNVPVIRSYGNEIYGFSKTQNGKIVDFSKEKFDSDTLLYARVYNYKFNGNFVPILEKKIGNVYIEFEKGLSDSIVNSYIKEIQGLYNIFPFLFDNDVKIQLMSKDLFETVFKSTQVGMTVNYNGSLYSTIFIAVSEKTFNSFDIGVVLHELSHVIDSNYIIYNNDRISSQSDLLKLYNTYINQENRPLRNYAYENTKEFWSEAVRYYYMNDYLHVDYTSSKTNNNITPELKEIVKKYLCIVKNNYNDKASC